MINKKFILISLILIFILILYFINLEKKEHFSLNLLKIQNINVGDKNEYYKKNYTLDDYNVECPVHGHQQGNPSKKKGNYAGCYEINKLDNQSKEFYDKNVNIRNDVSSFKFCKGKANINKYFGFIPKSFDITDENTINSSNIYKNLSCITPNFDHPPAHLKKVPNFFCQAIKDNRYNLGGYMNGKPVMALYQNKLYLDSVAEHEDLRKTNKLDFTIDEMIYMKQKSHFIGGVELFQGTKVNDYIDYYTDNNYFIKDYSGNNNHIETNLTKYNTKYGNISLGSNDFLKLDSINGLLKKGLEDNYNLDNSSSKGFTIYLEYNNNSRYNETPLITRSYNSVNEKKEYDYEYIDRTESLKKVPYSELYEFYNEYYFLKTTPVIINLNDNNAIDGNLAVVKKEVQYFILSFKNNLEQTNYDGNFIYSNSREEKITFTIDETRDPNTIQKNLNKYMLKFTKIDNVSFYIQNIFGAYLFCPDTKNSVNNNSKLIWSYDYKTAFYITKDPNLTINFKSSDDNNSTLKYLLAIENLNNELELLGITDYEKFKDNKLRINLYEVVIDESFNKINLPIKGTKNIGKLKENDDLSNDNYEYGIFANNNDINFKLSFKLLKNKHNYQKRLVKLKPNVFNEINKTKYNFNKFENIKYKLKFDNADNEDYYEDKKLYNNDNILLKYNNIVSNRFIELLHDDDEFSKLIDDDILTTDSINILKENILKGEDKYSFDEGDRDTNNFFNFINLHANRKYIFKDENTKKIIIENSNDTNNENKKNIIIENSNDTNNKEYLYKNINVNILNLNIKRVVYGENNILKLNGELKSGVVSEINNYTVKKKEYAGNININLSKDTHILYDNSWKINPFKHKNFYNDYYADFIEERILLNFDGIDNIGTPYNSSDNFWKTMNEHHTLKDRDDLKLTEEFSISLWIKPSSYNKYDYYSLIGKGDETATRNYCLWLVGNHTTLEYGDDHNGKIRFDIYGDGQLVSFSSVKVPLNKWTHIAFTFKKNDSINLYVNAVVVWTNTTYTITPVTNDNQVQIGTKSVEKNNKYDWGAFDGEMNRMRIYGKKINLDYIEKEFLKGPTGYQNNTYHKMILCGNNDKNEYKYYDIPSGNCAKSSNINNLNEDSYIHESIVNDFSNFKWKDRFKLTYEPNNNRIKVERTDNTTKLWGFSELPFIYRNTLPQNYTNSFTTYHYNSLSKYNCYMNFLSVDINNFLTIKRRGKIKKFNNTSTNNSFKSIKIDFKKVGSSFKIYLNDNITNLTITQDDLLNKNIDNDGNTLVGGNTGLDRINYYINKCGDGKTNTGSNLEIKNLHIYKENVSDEFIKKNNTITKYLRFRDQVLKKAKKVDNENKNKIGSDIFKLLFYHDDENSYKYSRSNEYKDEKHPINMNCYYPN